ncbi:MAG TPA: hypothetical protein VFS59_14220 [Gemmatimonadaceae bacterium]|nr:hypothetical protein [Gemmatimonadaceae bacterium]
MQSRAPRVSSLFLAAAAMALAACGSQDASGPGGTPGVTTLNPGQVVAVPKGTTVTLEGGSTGTENVLVVVDTGLQSISAKTSWQVSATGTGAAGAVSGPATALLPSEGADAARSGSIEPTVDIGFGMRLNARNRQRFVGGFRAARSAFASRTAVPPGMSRSVGVVDPNIGDIFTINVALSACGSSVNRAARVVAIGTQSIVLADTLNPTGGFTASDYQRFAARFDTLVYPLGVANFGAPADIDQNKKIVLLFTTAVNALTPSNSTSYVAGFFFDRDLFPIADTPDFQGCAGSNYSELFYLLAPDPSGLVNGNVRRTGFVDSVTTAVIAHEFQHLINSSRRLYVTPNVEDFEVVWLNEGLSHIAEELLFLHEAGLTPRRNLDTIAVRSSARIRSAFNADMASNTARYRSFLDAPATNSPFRDDDSLETRGATWNLLRYLADRKAGSSTSDAATWQALVNTARTGMSNLGAVFGDIPGKVRDWNVSHYADDLVSGLPAEYTQPSWNFHSIYKALAGSGKAYPLEVKALAGGSASGTLIGGAAEYYRFSVPANATATITLTSSGPIDARVVRIR